MEDLPLGEISREFLRAETKENSCEKLLSLPVKITASPIQTENYINKLTGNCRIFGINCQAFFIAESIWKPIATCCAAWGQPQEEILATAVFSKV